jgi:hypothetical protein
MIVTPYLSSHDSGHHILLRHRPAMCTPLHAAGALACAPHRTITGIICTSTLASNTRASSLTSKLRRALSHRFSFPRHATSATS